MDETPNSKPPDVTDQVIAGTGEPTKTLRKHRLRWIVLAHVAIGLSTGMLVAWTRSPSKPNLSGDGFRRHRLLPDKSGRDLGRSGNAFSVEPTSGRDAQYGLSRSADEPLP